MHTGPLPRSEYSSRLGGFGETHYPLPTTHYALPTTLTQWPGLVRVATQLVIRNFV